MIELIAPPAGVTLPYLAEPEKAIQASLESRTSIFSAL
jgi:hypothetical protein